jgi:hypothetical protein
VYYREQGRVTNVGYVLSFSGHVIRVVNLLVVPQNILKKILSLVTTKATKQTVTKAVVLHEYLFMNVKLAACTTVLEWLWVQMSSNV